MLIINMVQEVIKKGAIRRMLKIEGFRIGDKNLIKLNKEIEEGIYEFLKKITRSALTSGRKTIREEDIVSSDKSS